MTIGGVPAANVHPLPEDDVIVYSGPAERGDTTGLPRLFGDGPPRYRWRFTAHGVAVTYRTDAAGLQLSGRVVSRPMTFGDPVTLVQLVDQNGRVVASMRAITDETLTARMPDDYTRIDAVMAHIYSPGVCWCAPSGLGYHVNEDGSPC